MNKLQAMFPTVEEGDFLRVALEGVLHDCLEDTSVAGVVAGQALHLAKHGSTAFLWETDGAGTPLVVPEGESAEDFRHLSPGPQAVVSRIVGVEFSPEAFAWMEATRIHDGYGSAEDFIRGCVAGTVASLMEGLTSEREANNSMREVFGVLSTGTNS